jgi:hypothetical protein
MSEATVESGAPRVRFPGRERRGVLLGLTFSQIVLIGTAIAAVVVALWINPIVFSVVVIPASLAVVLGVARIRRESLLLIGWQMARYLHRAITGQTHFRRDVWARVATASIELGTVRAGEILPTISSRFMLPGPLGEIQLIQIPASAGYSYDPQSGLAAVTVQVQASAWALRDPGAQEGAYKGFVDLLSGLERNTGLAEVVVRVRVDRASSTEMTDYLQARQEATTPQVSAGLKMQYYRLITAAAHSSMAFTMQVTYVFNTRSISTLVKESGGGMTGLGKILTARMATIARSLEHAGVRVQSWLNAAELELALANATDPVSMGAQRERAATGRTDTVQATPMMGIDEEWASVRIDQSWHRTSWIAEWPRTEVNTGFLEPLLYGGDHSRVLTIQLRPVALHKALAEVERAQADMEAAAQIRTKLRSSSTVQHDREAEALLRREEDLVDGYADVSFRGFITVSADTEQALDEAHSQTVDASHQARVVLAPLYGQQAAALVAAALPIGVQATGVKKGK